MLETRMTWHTLCNYYNVRLVMFDRIVRAEQTKYRYYSVIHNMQATSEIVCFLEKKHVSTIPTTRNARHHSHHAQMRIKVSSLFKFERR